MSNIKKGYQLSIVSYENDGDGMSTINLYGLTKDDVTFYLNFLKVFSLLGLENRYDEPFTEKEIQKFTEKLMIIYENSIPEKYNVCYGHHDNVVETSKELLGYSDEFYSRYLGSYNVYYIPEEIINVTNEF
ncbi:MAG: hypothetical protein [Caudoviricetes sp.]|nr:MAG: hypothetical protein [Caudoviricetes sp.]